MSFRTRLTTFFAVIVVVPMIAVGVLVFRLIGQSEQSKAQARASGLASAAASVYASDMATARSDAAAIARSLGRLGGDALERRVDLLQARAGLARVTVSEGRRVIVDVGSSDAVAPGAAVLRRPGRAETVTVSELTAAAYARALSGPGSAIVVRDGPTTRSSTFSPPNTDSRSVTQRFPGFGSQPVTVTAVSSLSASDTGIGSSRLLAAALIAGFLVLALGFAILASRALQGQLSRFLDAARQLGSGDFSFRVPTDGEDEFAALGEEFNQMSDQLARRLDELGRERARLREAIHRIGQTLASNLDRQALLELALRTAVDAVEASCGRLLSRASADDALSVSTGIGSLKDTDDSFEQAEGKALASAGVVRETRAEDLMIASVALGPIEPGGPERGVISVARRGLPFSDEDRDMLSSLATQASVALENVELHDRAKRQAITDPLTGLANHGRFQELMSHEAEQVRRYHYSLSLIMLDIDDFKSINDTYGHQQGDAVLRAVARVLRENSREVDLPARYGGEELALILPHTDLDGAYVIAERIRVAVEALRVRRVDDLGELGVTISAGVAASNAGRKRALIADADAALYQAKREGKNRTVKAEPQIADVIGAE